MTRLTTSFLLFAVLLTGLLQGNEPCPKIPSYLGEFFSKLSIPRKDIDPCDITKSVRQLLASVGSEELIKRAEAIADARTGGKYFDVKRRPAEALALKDCDEVISIRREYALEDGYSTVVILFQKLPDGTIGQPIFGISQRPVSLYELVAEP